MEETQLLPLIVILLIFVSPAFAIVEDEALQVVLDADNKKSLYHKEAEALLMQLKHLAPIDIDLEKDFLDQSNLPLNPIKTPLSCGVMDYHKEEISQAIPNNNKMQYLIFVSFSMPKESLKSLYLDSINHNATLVMRGLIDGSFKKTAEQLKSLGIIVQIDPKVFSEYQVTKVPTIALIADNNQVNTISGNISFNYAKDQLLRAL